MWFLLIQIFVLLVLAAICGAALMWWWLRRRQEDVTDSHAMLQAQADRLDSLATRDDIAVARDTLGRAVADLRMPDVAPLEMRIAQLEKAVSGISIPEPDFSRVTERLEMIEAHMLSPDQEIGEIRTQLSGLRAALAPVAETVGGLRNTDLRPLEEQIGRMELRLGEMQSRFDSARRTDIEAVTARLANISAMLGALDMPDLAPVQTQLSDLRSAVASIRIPEPDLAPAESMLADLKRAVAALDKPPIDLGPLHGRLSALETSLASLMAPVERRVAGVEEALAGMPPPDLSPIISAVHTIDNREGLGAVEDRLTAIEYSLAALHHMLRARVESQTARQERLSAPHRAPRSPARPARDLDPINAVRRVDDQANLLVEPAFGPPDDLKQINGVGPILCEMLHDLGVFYFWQVAEWTPEEAAWVDGQLAHFRGRIARDGWVEHARELAAAAGAARRPTGYGGLRPLP